MENVGKTVFDILKKLGLSKQEAKIYLSLSKSGPKKVSEIAKTNGIHRVLIYTLLKNLQQKQMIQTTSTYPKNFTAVPLNKVFDQAIKIKEEKIQNLNSNKNSILTQWNQQIPNTKQLTTHSFMVFEGSKYIHSKMKQILTKAKNTIKIATNYEGIIQANNTGIFEICLTHPLMDKINFKLLTSLENANVNWSMLIELFNRSKEICMPIEVRIIDLGKTVFPKYVTVDNSELMLSLNPLVNSPYGDKNEVALWTDNKILINAFRAYFDGLWANASDFSN